MQQTYRRSGASIGSAPPARSREPSPSRSTSGFSGTTGEVMHEHHEYLSARAGPESGHVQAAQPALGRPRGRPGWRTGGCRRRPRWRCRGMLMPVHRNRAAQFPPRNSRRAAAPTHRANSVTSTLQFHIFLPPPCSAAAFVVNSEPHSGARLSVRLCVEPELFRCVHYRKYAPRTAPPPSS